MTLTPTSHTIVSRIRLSRFALDHDASEANPGKYLLGMLTGKLPSPHKSGNEFHGEFWAYRADSDHYLSSVLYLPNEYAEQLLMAVGFAAKVWLGYPEWDTSINERVMYLEWEAIFK